MLFGIYYWIIKKCVICPKFLKDVAFNLQNTTCCSSSKPSILFTFTFKSHLKTNIHIYDFSQRIKSCWYISKCQFSLLHHSFDNAQEFIYFHEYLLIVLYLHSLKQVTGFRTCQGFLTKISNCPRKPEDLLFLL